MKKCDSCFIEIDMHDTEMLVFCSGECCAKYFKDKKEKELKCKSLK